MSPELQELFFLLRSEDLQLALEAAQEIAYHGDATNVPDLFKEMEWCKREFERRIQDCGGLDAKEGQRLFAIEMAIISLLSLDESQQELKAGRLWSEWLVERRENTSTLDEFWGPLRD